LFVLALLVLGAGAIRSLSLDYPAAPLVFDEVFYVNAARLLAGLPAGSPYDALPTGVDPNVEHPALGKLLMALTIRVFGDGPLAWRLPSLVAGLLAPPLTFAIARRYGASATTALIAATLLSFDELSSILGRTATLDTLASSGLLVSAALLAYQHRLAAGIACGVSAGIKLNAAASVVALVLIDVLLARSQTDCRAPWPLVLRRCALLVGGFAVAGFTVIALTSVLFTPYRSPWEHLGVMLHYAAELTDGRFPPGGQSRPWDWPLYGGQMVYFFDGGLVIRGSVHPLLIGSIVPAMAFAVWRSVRKRDALSLWVTVWMLVNYGGLVVLAATVDRIMYIHYLLPCLPAVALASANLLGHRHLPLAIRVGFVVAYGTVFLLTWPFNM
jgi:dolichyl-phosphate-mannose-protein mannosyltransferase